MAAQRVEKRADLPAPKMSREQQHALATLFGHLEILEALIDRNLPYVLGRVLRKLARFAEQPAQRDIHSAQNPAPLGWRFLGKRQLKITSPHSAQTRMHVVDDATDQDPNSMRQRT